MSFFNSSVEEFAKHNQNSFDLVLSQSVIEHTADPKRHLAALSELLKPNGRLLLSTDYFPEKIDCSGIFPYGIESPEMCVFSKSDMEQLLNNTSFIQTTGDLAPANQQAVVTWERVERSYTFLFVDLTKK